MKKVLAPLVRVLVVCAPLAFAAFPACVDTSPIDYHASSARDAGPEDAASGSSDASRVTDCRDCVTKETCAADYAKCAADPRCEKFMSCLLDTYCVNFPGDLSQLPPCLTTCGLQAEIKSAVDPVITLFRPVLFCTQDRCGAPCGLPKK
jgi:hypothetical protein